jgi:hypothetical protein
MGLAMRKCFHELPSLTPSGQSCSQLLHQFTKTYVEDMELLQFDVKMIFLHGDLEEEVYLATQGL